MMLTEERLVLVWGASEDLGSFGLGEVYYIWTAAAESTSEKNIDNLNYGDRRR